MEKFPEKSPSSPSKNNSLKEIFDKINGYLLVMEKAS